MSETLALSPSLTPEDEAALPQDYWFISACMAKLSDHATKQGYRLGKSVLTRSSEWGLVWRADFKTEATDFWPDSPLVNRIICWSKSDGEVNGVCVAHGQKIERL